MRNHWLITGISMCLLSPLFADADDAQEPVRTLSLDECRRLALEKNLAFRVSRLAPVSSETQVSTALATFDPALTTSVFRSRTQQPNALLPDPSSGKYVSRSFPAQNSLRSSVGLEKDFAFGANVSLSLSNSWTKGSGLSNYSSSLRFDVTQPLLRGFGPTVNESGLRIARNNLDISLSVLREGAISTVQQVEEAYWDLVNAIEVRAVAELSLQYAGQLLDRSRTRAESGVQAARDVLQAEVGVANARQGIISAQAAVRAAEDRLKQLTNLASDPGGWGVSIVPADTPHVAGLLQALDTFVATALENSPAVYQAETSLKTRRLSLRVRADQLLPSLNATGGLTFSDGDTLLSKSVDDIATGTYPSWSAGLTLSIPLGNRTAEANYRQAVVDVRSAALRVESARQQVYADVRAAVRRIETSRQQLAAALESRRLQEANLENEQERLRLGLSTNYDVLRLEKDLADARRAVLQARIEHEKALLALDVATGRLLQARDITIEGENVSERGE